MRSDVDFFVYKDNKDKKDCVLSNNLIISNGEKKMKLNCLGDLPELIELRWIKGIAPLMEEHEGVKRPSLNGIDILLADGIEAEDVWDMVKQPAEGEYDYLQITEPTKIIYHNAIIIHERLTKLFLNESWTEQERIEHAELRWQFDQLGYLSSCLQKGANVAFNEETELFYLVP
ncbi:hypothetical protein BCR24_06495 [Enterococcus ureilyticus]|uniref:Uncharacterized protein n=1 Tax=Enterococcus ureilyticus TaxID=1131292 RepID=A0A1E5H9A0_9ENTE|nr:hypothetical protein [Enterococcus ureilyticus]MBM7688415.1 hypothetical protein [Enterococcus ureilyticus]OEG21518.1 hypothetical protein BCR24_06495 [Enterococcus ureilyticus]